MVLRGAPAPALVALLLPYNMTIRLSSHLVHKGAFVRAVSESSTAADVLRAAGANSAQILYLDPEEREYFVNPGYDGGELCRVQEDAQLRHAVSYRTLSHWRVHRVGCRHHACG
jgi:hypothetical protein